MAGPSGKALKRLITRRSWGALELAAASPVVVRVRNESGTDLKRYQVVGVYAPLFDPIAAQDAFLNQGVVLKCASPEYPKDCGRIAVVLEPLAQGAIGRACVAGVVPCRLIVNHVSHRWADITDASGEGLVSAPAGSAYIVWHSGTTGEQWALVSLGCRGVPIYHAEIWFPEENDYEDNRYFAYPQVVTSDDGDPDGEIELGPDPWHSALITVTNLAEQATKTHGLANKTIVTVMETWDASEPPIIRLVCNHPAKVTALWAVISDVTDRRSNKVKANPCKNADGEDPDTEKELDLLIEQPDMSPTWHNIRVGDVVAYVELPGEKYLIISPPTPRAMTGEITALDLLNDKVTVDYDDGGNVESITVYVDSPTWNTTGHKTYAPHLQVGDTVTFVMAEDGKAHAVNVLTGTPHKLLDRYDENLDHDVWPYKVHTDVDDADPATGKIVMGKNDMWTDGGVGDAAATWLEIDIDAGKPRIKHADAQDAIQGAIAGAGDGTWIEVGGGGNSFDAKGHFKPGAEAGKVSHIGPCENVMTGAKFYAGVFDIDLPSRFCLGQGEAYHPYHEPWDPCAYGGEIGSITVATYSDSGCQNEQWRQTLPLVAYGGYNGVDIIGWDWQDYLTWVDVFRGWSSGCGCNEYCLNVPNENQLGCDAGGSLWLSVSSSGSANIHPCCNW